MLLVQDELVTIDTYNKGSTELLELEVTSVTGFLSLLFEQGDFWCDENSKSTVGDIGDVEEEELVGKKTEEERNLNQSKEGEKLVE
jgi:hypothetical protein